MSIALLSRFNAPRPKKILSLDGGGIRGVISLGFLKKIEDTLRERNEDPNLVLSDYFDLIGGTSTGSIIATFLAMGRTVDEISNVFEELGPQIFRPKKWYYKYLGPVKYIIAARFSADKLEEMLDRYFKGWTLGDARMKTGLCIITTRADTRTTTSFVNHPLSRGYGHFEIPGQRTESNEDNTEFGKRTIKLSDILRASTAAPGVFKPKEISVYYKDRETWQSDEIDSHVQGAFMDGGVGSLNNPALYLYLMATLKCFPFQWKTGHEELFMVSVGTGYSNYREDAYDILNKKWMPQLLDIIIDNFLQDASEMNQTVLQCIARTPQPNFIDEELGDLKDEFIGNQRLLTYLRYNAQFNTEPMKKVGMEKYIDHLTPLHSLDNYRNIPKLEEIGTAFADLLVHSDHFEGFDRK